MTRVAIVTGGTSDIGRAIAGALAADGCDCVLAARNAERLAEAAANVPLPAGRAIETVVADVRDDADRRALVARCLERFGRLDVLVNSAGGSTAAPLLDFTPDAWRDDLATNLDGPFHLSQAALEPMTAQSGGRIVNIGSIYGFQALNNAFYEGRYPRTTEGGRGPVRAPGYAAAKGGLLTLTRELAAAAGPHGVTVNMVSPGMIPVPSRPMDERRRAAMTAATPVGRLGTPEDVAEAVRFLASERAGYITGVNLVVDGGWSIW